MKDNILVSIIVPVYRVEQYIDECLASLVDQTYRNIEILLIDDGSTDNSGRKCDAWGKTDDRIRVFHKENEGLGLTRNYGLERARGDYVVFQDSDDYIALDMIEKMLSEREKVDADTVIGGHYKFNEHKILYTERYEYAVYYGGQVGDRLLPRFVGSMPDKKDGLFQTAWCKLYSLKIIRENGLKFVSEREWISEDMVFQLDYFRCSKTAVVLSEALYFYRENNSSLTGKYHADGFERQKKMYLYVRDKLNEYNLLEKEGDRLGKLFLVQIYGVLDEEINQSGKTRGECLRRLNDILHDGIVKDALENYPIARLKLAQMCFAYMVKHKCRKCLYVCFQLKKWF